MSTLTLKKPFLLASISAALFLIGILFTSSAVDAQATGSIAQGFTASNDKGDIVAGALVSLKANSQDVELATTETAERLVGVADQNPLVVISGNSQEVQVVLGGATSALVSDINGDVKSGDRITASPVAGVGMTATASARVIGIAQADLDTAHSQTRTVTDSRGKTHTIHIGSVPVQIGLSNYQAPSSDFLPPFIQSIANNIAGKQVSIVRILFCSILLLMSFVSLAIFIASTARSAMVSIGRNPLASPDIRKSLYQVGAITVAAWGGALVACYLILTL